MKCAFVRVLLYTTYHIPTNVGKARSLHIYIFRVSVFYPLFMNDNPLKYITHVSCRGRVAGQGIRPVIFVPEKKKKISDPQPPIPFGTFSIARGYENLFKLWVLPYFFLCETVRIRGYFEINYVRRYYRNILKMKYVKENEHRRGHLCPSFRCQGQELWRKLNSIELYTV